MIDKLKELGFKNLPTLNQLVVKINDIELIKDYNEFLKLEPKRTDFINFDEDGFALNDNKPLFKGFSQCLDSSSEKIKVAKFGDCRIYFETKDGVIIVNTSKMTDNSTYNDLAIFFDGKLKINR
tara:strand:- start:891 stop:1262 length:372 start_codon:yes stop_codon:yes gene_type:complete